MAKRQTIWLSTMMVLSLMLIGFYTVNNNVQQVGTTNQTTGKQQSAPKQDTNKDSAQTTMEQSDYFVAQHLQDQQNEGKQEQTLEAVIANAQAPADKVEQAKKDLANFRATQEKIDKVTDAIDAEGYPDALVELKNGKVNVTVQAQTLDNQKAVRIMDIVSKTMNVSASTIIVSAHE